METRSYGLTGRDLSRRQYWLAINAAQNNSTSLESLVADNPQQAASVRQLQAAIG